MYFSVYTSLLSILIFPLLKSKFLLKSNLKDLMNLPGEVSQQGVSIQP